MITEKEVRSIFSEIQVIALYSQTFLAELEQRRFVNRTLPRPLHIYGDIFRTMSHFCRSYVQYINNYNAAMTSLSSVRERDEFSGWIGKQEHLLGEPLESVLITPIQRIPRYVLLLNELVRHTPLSYSDRPNIVESRDRMRDLALSVNESKREAEGMVELMRIHSLLFPLPQNFILPHRRFIHQGELFYFEKDGDPPVTKWAFLFSDIMLVTRKVSVRKSGFSRASQSSLTQVSSPRDSMIPAEKGSGSDLVRYQLQIMLTLQSVTSVKSLGGGGFDYLRNCFVIDTSKGITLMFHCNSEMDQQAWVSHLNERLRIFAGGAGTRKTVELPSKKGGLENIFRKSVI